MFLWTGFTSYSQCTNTSSFGSATAPASIGASATISTCSFQTEYSTVSGLVAGNTYSIAMSSGGCVTVHSGTPNGPVVAFGTAPLSFTPTAGGTYYFHWNVNCGPCATNTACITTSITMTAGTGPPPPLPCSGGANSSCATADPFCTATVYNYCNTTGTPSLGQYACLFTTPNPVWYYLNIATSGPIDIFMSQTATGTGLPIDVDFILYGPFTSTAAACAAIAPSTTIPARASEWQCVCHIPVQTLANRTPCFQGCGVPAPERFAAKLQSLQCCPAFRWVANAMS